MKREAKKAMHSSKCWYSRHSCSVRAENTIKAQECQNLPKHLGRGQMATWAEGLRCLSRVTQGGLWTVKPASLRVSIQYSTMKPAANWTHFLAQGWSLWCISHRTVNEWHWKDIESQKPLSGSIPQVLILSSWRSQHSMVGSTAKPVVTAWCLLASADSLMVSALELPPTQRRFCYLKVTKNTFLLFF